MPTKNTAPPDTTPPARNRANKPPDLRRPSPQAEMVLRNRQRSCPVDRPAFLRAVRHLLAHHLLIQRYALGFHLVPEAEIIRLNSAFLQHQGPTDVITFDHRDPRDDLQLHGELFLCTDVALRQARRFRTSWPDELLRYTIHGLLHLVGYDDRHPSARRRMKKVENRLLRCMRAFPIARAETAACPVSLP